MSDIVYFDNAATTAMDERVLEAMLPYMRELYGNANGKYSVGYASRKAVNEARRSAALMIGAEPDEIYFTSGGTESNNTVINGFLENNGSDNSKEALGGRKRIIVSTEIEHDSVLSRLKAEEAKGAEIKLLNVDSECLADPDRLNDLLEKSFANSNKNDIGSAKNTQGLVSVMLVNNETGTEQPIRELSQIAHAHNCIFHTDAVQAAGHMKINVKEMGIDSMSVSGHKLYGPKGTGFIYIKRGLKLKPLIFGGGQEHGMRSGTENVAGIVGLGMACELALAEYDQNIIKEQKIADYLKNRFLSRIPNTGVNGSGKWILNFSFAGVNGTSLALRLDMEGICVSTGSACSSGLGERSHVLTAIGLTPEQADSSIRISIGKYNTIEEAEYTASSIERLVNELRSLRETVI